MSNQGGMFVNGERVDGRTLSFDVDGLKVSNGEEEKIVVPNNGFDFAEEAEVTESDFADVDNAGYSKSNSLLYDMNKACLNKKVLIGAGIAVGVIAAVIIGGVISKKKG